MGDQTSHVEIMRTNWKVLRRETVAFRESSVQDSLVQDYINYSLVTQSTPVYHYSRLNSKLPIKKNEGEFNFCSKLKRVFKL